MRSILLYLAALLNFLLATRALTTGSASLFWWSLGCGLLLALGGVLSEAGPGGQGDG